MENQPYSIFQNKNQYYSYSISYSKKKLEIGRILGQEFLQACGAVIDNKVNIDTISYKNNKYFI